jgi:hypothetical protein
MNRVSSYADHCAEAAALQSDVSFEAALAPQAPAAALVSVDYYEAPSLLRPVAIKVSNGAANDLYELAYEHQVGGYIHQGVMDAHAWNEKWHPMAGLDRSSGAKNPSPEDCDYNEEEPIIMVLDERRERNKRKSQNDYERPPAPKHNLIRPIAVRVQRPQAQAIPSDIISHHNNNTRSQILRDDANLSPLSIRSVSSSSDSEDDEDEEPLQRMDAPLKMMTSVIHPTIRPEHMERLRQRTLVAPLRCQPSPSTLIQAAVQTARDGLLQALAAKRGDTTENSEFTLHLDFLKQHYAASQPCAQAELKASCGLWLSLTKPLFFGCLGETDDADPLYTMGRMSFDMFAPTSLVCSLQGCFNQVNVVVGDRSHDEHLVVPKRLKEEVQAGDTTLQTYK